MENKITKNKKEIKNKDTTNTNTIENTILLGTKREREEEDDIKINKIKPDQNKEIPQITSPGGTVQNIPLPQTNPLTNNNYPNYNIISAIPPSGNYGYYATPINYYSHSQQSKILFFYFNLLYSLYSLYS